jgi:hypothetical protein
MADDQKPYRSRRLRDVDPIWPVNVFTPVCACPHGDNDLNEGDYCPICHKLWKRAEQHKSMIRSPLTDPKPEPKKKHAPELPGGTGSLKAKSEWELAGVGRVKAWTKSEARAAFKVMLGLARLPVGSKVKKV